MASVKRARLNPPRDSRAEALADVDRAIAYVHATDKTIQSALKASEVEYDLVCVMCDKAVFMTRDAAVAIARKTTNCTFAKTIESRLFERGLRVCLDCHPVCIFCGDAMQLECLVGTAARCLHGGEPIVCSEKCSLVHANGKYFSIGDNGTKNTKRVHPVCAKHSRTFLTKAVIPDCPACRKSWAFWIRYAEGTADMSEF